ncbi:MAG: hypothetical protein ACKV2U_08600 [Bryobacteraceae bacterium]
MQYTIQLAAVIGTIGLLWLTLHALRRFRSTQNPGARVQIQQRLSIANGCQLVVVNWDGRELLIATGNQPCTLVASKLANEAPVRAEASGAWAH